MNGHAVIVVRDLDLLAGLGELLAQEGVTATLVPREADVPAALRSLGPAAAAAVLLVGDGVDVERLSSTNLPVIVLEGVDRRRTGRVEARVAMPIDPDELLSAMSRVLAAHGAVMGLVSAEHAGQP